MALSTGIELVPDSETITVIVERTVGLLRPVARAKNARDTHARHETHYHIKDGASPGPHIAAENARHYPRARWRTLTLNVIQSTRSKCFVAHPVVRCGTPFLLALEHAEHENDPPVKRIP